MLRSPTEILVGASLSDSSIALESGAAYVFIGAENAWIEQAKLFASSLNSGERFGTHVALDGETAVVTRAFSATPPFNGSAFVFVRNGGVWSLKTEIKPIDLKEGDFFANSLSLSSDTVLLGSPSVESIYSTGDSNVGAVYLHEIDLFQSGFETID